MTEIILIIIAMGFGWTGKGVYQKVSAPKAPYDGEINQETGLYWQAGHWERAWWQDQFEVAKKKGCYLADSCGVFPPYYIPAQYCGEPKEKCEAPK